MDNCHQSRGDMCIPTKKAQSLSKEKLFDLSPNITIHSNIRRPIQITTLGDKRYFLTMATARQKMVRVHLLREKTEAAVQICNYIVWPGGDDGY